MVENVKKLYRSKTDQMLGGVCAGIAKYVSMDPTVIRLLWVLVTLFGGSGVLIYLVLLVVIPLEP